MSQQSDNMEAVNRYFHDQPKNTPEATRLFDEWVVWYNNLSWASKNLDEGLWGVNSAATAAWDEARNRLHAFDLANVTSQADKDFVTERQKAGLSTEQMQGHTDRRTSTGNYVVQKPPWIPSWVWWTGAIVFTGITGITVVFAGKAAAETFVKKHL